MSGRGPKLGTGKTLVPVQSVVTEASAFRITPTYVYAYKYKDGSKAAGIVPVHIKHANVWKHWDDLVDPDPGSPLNNLVIGTIPKYYKNPSQLQPKDPQTKVSDLMSKDGEAGAKEAERIGTPAMPPGVTPGVPLADYLKIINFGADPESLLKSPTLVAHLEAQYGKDWKEKAVALGFKIKGVKAAPAPVTYAPEVTAMAAVLGYAPNTPEADALQSMFQHGEFALALDEYVKAKGQKKLKKNLEAALPVLMKVYQAAQAKGLVDEAEPDDNGDVALKFHPAKASPIVAAPPPAPTPAPKPVEPPKPAAVEGLPPTGLIATKASFTGTVGHKAAQSLPISQQQALGLADTDPDDIEVNKTLLGALAGHDPVSSAPLLNHLAQRLAYATDSKVTEKHMEAASNFAARAVLLGLAIDTELGFTAHPKIKAFFTTQGSPAPTPPVPTPAPAPVPPAPAPAPVSAPAPAQAGLGKLSVPPLATLTSAGIATGLGGVHDKQFLTDKNGNKYLFKPSAGATSAAAGSAYANLASKVLGPDKVIPVVAGTVAGGGYGSVQPFLTGAKDLSNVPLTSLTGPQLQTLMRERVMDWALSNHDTKAANFVLLPDGTVVGVDKEQALKHIGKDSLDLSYKHTPSSPPQLYSQIFDLFQKKKLDVPVVAMLPAIKNIEAISDAEWLAAFQGYFDALPDNQKEAKKKAILARKKSLRKDLEGLVTDLLRARGDIGPEDQFAFEAEDAEDEAKKKKKKPIGGVGALPPEPVSSANAPPVGSVLSAPIIPDLSSLTTKNEKVKGSTGQSFLFYDGYGKKYVVKQAVARGGSMKPQPYRAAAQEIFSQVSSAVRPGKSLAVGIIPGGYKGVPATLQPWIENSKPLGKGTSPASLSASVKKDIAEEHALDWLLSQHDTHGDNLLVRPDGSVVSIDKEQGFKYFMGAFSGPQGPIPPDTKLSTDYHPNAAYGEDEAYYNKFWRAFADGSMDFDPKDMVGAIERIESIKDSDYTQLLSKFAQSASFKDDPQKVAEFYKRALERKKNIRKDFEEFITGLYKKRNKTEGSFTFAGGWSAAVAPEPAAPKKKKPVAGSAAPSPAATPSAGKALGGSEIIDAFKVSMPAPTEGAAKAVDATLAAIFPASGAPADIASLPVWSEAVEGTNKEMTALRAGLNEMFKVPASAIQPSLEAEAKKAHPDNPLLQQAAVQQALNQRNKAKAQIEKRLTSLMEAKTGQKGKFTLAKGWSAFGVTPAPITHTENVPVSQIATEMGFTVEQSFNGDFALVALKAKGADWAQKQKEFEAKTGLSAAGPVKEKPSQSAGTKVFIPYDKTAFAKATVQKTWVEQPPAPGSDVTPPSPKTPNYFPEHEPALPLTTTYEDLGKVQTASLGEAGKMYPSDGTGVENNNITVQRIFDSKTGKTKYAVNFKLRPELWSTLANAGTAGTYSWFQGKYDKSKDAIVSSDRYGMFSLPTRKVQTAAGELHYSVGTPPNTYDPKKSSNTEGYSANNWAHMGAVLAEVELNEGEDITDKLKGLLDQMQPGLGEKVFRKPAPEDAEVSKLARVVWSQLPKLAQKLKPTDFTLANLQKIAADNKIPKEYLDAQETEVFPGYRSYVVPGRWKSKKMTLPDGSPKVRFMLTSSNTPSNIVKNLANGPGPLSQTMRLQSGVGLGNGQSMDSDRTSGGAEQSMWRMVTASKGGYSLDDGMIRGNVSGTYRYLIPPDELDRLDTVHYLGDAYGNMSGQGNGSPYWANRKSLEDAVTAEQDGPQGSSEVDFRKGVSSKRVLRVLCSTESERKAVLDEAKKQGVTEFNGIPVEDFVVATGSRSMEDIYQQFVKPMGY